MNKKLPVIAQAMGPRDGDFLSLSNTWATVKIRRERAAGQPDSFTVWGDAPRQEFPTLVKAMAYAWKHLGKYQAGRVEYNYADE